ncbi:MAG: urea carboxylase-associated family protein [SAR324 cluster bacterium]|nr:urea carboxylase-associated family protein [SAR324 cluster bacterium]MCZ6843240.1 urea carboxylase-associated family protein [SAR324 cluster bacterium]
MSDPSLITIPARAGKAARVTAGQGVKVINTHGSQVIDTWAFAADDLSEIMSMEHSRGHFRRANPAVGDSFVTNRRRPILTLEEDTSPGIHDTLIASCDRYRYEQMGCTAYHDNCTDNLHAALQELGLTPPEMPSPFNLFMNIAIVDNNELDYRAPLSKAGDYVLLRAEMDCIVAFSACPQDLIPINGADCTPREAHFTIIP